METVAKYFRWVMAAIAICYALWIAFPVVKAYVLPENDRGPAISSRSMDSTDYHGGYGNIPAPNVDPTASPMADSIQGDTAVDAIATGNKPVIWLWGAVIFLYCAAAFLHANGNVRATLIYLLGFVADICLTYLTNGDKSAGILDKIYTILSGWDPRYVLTLVAMVLGVLIYVSRRRRRAAKEKDVVATLDPAL